MEEYGDKDGPLLLFLHGGGVGGWMWKKQIDCFAAYHCLVPDLPGHGKSREIPFTIKCSAEEAIKLIQAYGHGKKIFVIGFSLGAQIAIQMAAMEPELIDAGVIASALAIPQPKAGKWVRPLIRLSFPLIKQKWFARLQAKALYIADEDFPQYFEESKKMDQAVLAAILEENMTFGIPHGFSKARGRFLVAAGEKEKAVMKQSVKEIAAAGKNSLAVILPDTGHGAPMASPVLFHSVAEAWLNGRELPGNCCRLS